MYRDLCHMGSGTGHGFHCKKLNKENMLLDHVGENSNLLFTQSNNLKRSVKPGLHTDVIAMFYHYFNTKNEASLHPLFHRYIIIM